MAFGLFRMMFNATGNAVPVLEQMTAASHRLVASSGLVATSLANQSRLLLSNASAADKTNVHFLSLVNRMNELSRSGQISSSTLLSLSKRMEVLGNVSAGSSLRMQGFSTQLLAMSANLKQAEQVASKAGSPQGGFQMMTDVSQGAAMRMRQISSSAQGAMIAMSLLQRNVTGLAFSLIFLQFSGFLKLSLAVAGALTGLAAIGFGFRALIKEGLRLSGLSDRFLVLTGNTQASSVAIDAARVIAEKFGVSLNDLTKVQLAQLIEGGSLNNEQFDTFGKLLKLSDAGILKNTKSSEDLINKFIKMREEGKGTDEILQSFGLTAKEITRRVQELDNTSLGKMRRSLANLKNEFVELTRGSGESAGLWWQRFSGAWIELTIGFISIAQGQWAQGLLSIFGGTTEIIDTTVGTIIRFMKNLAVSMFIDPWLDPVKDFTDMLKKTFVDMMPDIVTDGARIIRSILKFGWKLIIFDFDLFSFDTAKSISDFMRGDWSKRLQGLIDRAKVILGSIKEVGADIARNLWAGISSIPVVKWIFGWANSLINAIKNAFNISSPSKEMIEVGQNITKGLQQGITGRTASTSRGSSGITININVNGAFSNDPRAASRSVATTVLRGISRSGTFSGAPLVA